MRVTSQDQSEHANRAALKRWYERSGNAGQLRKQLGESLSDLLEQVFGYHTVVLGPYIGLDIDALRIVANGVNKIKSSSNAIVIITHYQRLLDHIIPDYVHVLQDGKIAKSGNKELALELEEKGYDWI